MGKGTDRWGNRPVKSWSRVPGTHKSGPILKPVFSKWTPQRVQRYPTWHESIAQSTASDTSSIRPVLSLFVICCHLLSFSCRILTKLETAQQQALAQMAQQQQTPTSSSAGGANNQATLNQQANVAQQLLAAQLAQLQAAQLAQLQEWVIIFQMNLRNFNVWTLNRAGVDPIKTFHHCTIHLVVLAVSIC